MFCFPNDFALTKSSKLHLSLKVARRGHCEMPRLAKGMRVVFGELRDDALQKTGGNGKRCQCVATLLQRAGDA